MLIWILACSLNGGESSKATVSAGSSTTSSDVEALPEVVALITVDTWRLDHFGPDQTPVMWQLAEQGERYTDAWSPIGLTTPAHATMLTGLLPWEHGVEGNNHHGYVLGKDVVTLPEQYQGWASGAFVSAYPAGPKGGLARGWEVFDGPEAGERAGAQTVARALDWLPVDRPALLWVHVYEPHGPYIGTGATERERYAEEVRRVDSTLAPLLEVLQRRNALIVLTSDHGEVLDEERCSYQHERTVSPHVLRVPLVRMGPGIQPAVIDRRIGLNDVPTLLKSGVPPARDVWVAESGMCEADCAPGCAPTGLGGRDRVAFDSGGAWIDRPGVGRMSRGTPMATTATALEAVPPWKPPAGPRTEGARTLGYLE